MKPSQKLNSNNLINPKWLMIGIVVLIIGYFLMFESPANSNNTFNADIFSHLHLSFAPFLVISGYALVGYSIFKA